MVVTTRSLSLGMLGMLASIWNVAHPPRKRGVGIVRCLKGGHYENARVHDALLCRGLIRESTKRRYTRLTAAGMRVLGVTASHWSPVHRFREWPETQAERGARDAAVRSANARFRAVCKLGAA